MPTATLPGAVETHSRLANQLTVIMGYLELLEFRSEPPAELRLLAEAARLERRNAVASLHELGALVRGE